MTRQRLILYPGDAILAEIADLLIEQNRLLGDIRDRLPEPTAGGQPDPGGQHPVEVSEPAPKLTPGRQSGPAPVSEPAKKTAPKKVAGRRRS